MKLTDLRAQLMVENAACPLFYKVVTRDLHPPPNSHMRHIEARILRRMLQEDFHDSPVPIRFIIVVHKDTGAPVPEDGFQHTLAFLHHLRNDGWIQVDDISYYALSAQGIDGWTFSVEPPSSWWAPVRAP